MAANSSEPFEVFHQAKRCVCGASNRKSLVFQIVPRVCAYLHDRGFNYPTASGNVASMREPLDGSLWWYWIAANAAKKNGASFKNYHRLSHLFYLCGVQIRQSLPCNMLDWSQG